MTALENAWLWALGGRSDHVRRTFAELNAPAMDVALAAAHVVIAEAEARLAVLASDAPDA